jgi:hypothetical protein
VHDEGYLDTSRLARSSFWAAGPVPRGARVRAVGSAASGSSTELGGGSLGLAQSPELTLGVVEEIGEEARLVRRPRKGAVPEPIRMNDDHCRGLLKLSGG